MPVITGLFIPLTRGHRALVSPEKYGEISKDKWCAQTEKSGATYAIGNIRNAAGKRTIQRMHRVLLAAPPGVQVDHERGVYYRQDPSTKVLDNRDTNLRLASPSQNQRNRGKRADNTSGFKGVSWDKLAGKWRAQIKLNRKCYPLGLYVTASEAAAAYDTACTFLHGLQFGRPNAQPDTDNPPPKVADLINTLIEQIVERSVNRPEDFTA